MRVSYSKYYVGAQIGGVVRTHVNGEESGYQSQEIIPGLGLVVKFTKNTTNKQGAPITVDESVLVPFNNIAYCRLVEEPKAEKTAKVK